jgi:hypothetical protein
MIGAQTRHEYGVVGPTVNLSARLMVAAQKVLLSPTPSSSPIEQPLNSTNQTNQNGNRLVLDKKAPPVILCDEETFKQCKTHFEFEVLSPIRVKGNKRARERQTGDRETDRN